MDSSPGEIDCDASKIDHELSVMPRPAALKEVVEALGIVGACWEKFQISIDHYKNNFLKTSYFFKEWVKK